MSGHSKFANIKHKKEKNDAAKGKVFTIIGREIAVAVKEGGPDPDNNSRLRDVIAKAKANNMPNDTIDRGIKKAAGADSAFLDTTVHSIVWHIICFCFCNYITKLAVVVGIRAACLDSHNQLTADYCKDLSLLCIVFLFLMLNVCKF